MTAQLVDELGEDAAREESEIVGLIARIFDLRATANLATKDEKPLAAQLRQFLELEGRDELIDGEHGLRAYLEPRSSTEWNVSRMPPGVVLYLAQAGLLTVDTKQFDLRRKNDGAVELDDARRYRMDKAGSSYALQIKSTKSG
jgi:hypothetical protein